MKLTLTTLLILLNLALLKSQNVNNLLTSESIFKYLLINNSQENVDAEKLKSQFERKNKSGIGIYLKSGISSSSNVGIINYSEEKANSNTSYQAIISGGKERNIGAFYTIEGENSTNIGIANVINNGKTNIGLLNSFSENYNNKEAANMGVYNKILNNGNGQKTTYNYGVISAISGTNNTNVAYSGYISDQKNDKGVTVFADNSENYLSRGEITAEESKNYGLHYKVKGSTSENTGLYVEVGLGRLNKAAHFKGDVMFESIEQAPYFIWSQHKGYIVNGYGTMPSHDRMGLSSISIGRNSFAYDNNSGAIGEGLITHQEGQLVVGRYNYTRNDTSMTITGSLFQVGNGRAEKRSNAFEATIEGRTFQDWVGINQPNGDSLYNEIDSALQTILRLKGLKYKWDDIYGHPHEDLYGFEIGSFKNSLPGLISRNSAAQRTLNMVALTPIITEAIKELHHNNEVQKKELETAFSLIEELKNELESLKKSLSKEEDEDKKEE